MPSFDAKILASSELSDCYLDGWDGAHRPTDGSDHRRAWDMGADDRRAWRSDSVRGTVRRADYNLIERGLREECSGRAF